MEMQPNHHHLYPGSPQYSAHGELKVPTLPYSAATRVVVVRRGRVSETTWGETLHLLRRRGK